MHKATVIELFWCQWSPLYLCFLYISRHASGSNHKTSNQHLCAQHNTTKSKSSNIRTYSKDSTDTDNEPIRFSTSKATQWNVDKSFGKDRKQRPVWQVAAVSTIMICVLGWAFLRKENELDELLGKDLNEQLEEIRPNFKVAEPGKDRIIARWHPWEAWLCNLNQNVLAQVNYLEAQLLILSW